ncbi:MAG: ABC transporter ATP-binding protein, partial [Lachnospiraceae bacterium]|nr:ABC transporter ATP-binding protein [Lachnospiraceae bacterium]
LCAYTGTVLYVSHDRYFINRTAHRILDLNRRTLTNYLGNYDYYLEKKEEQLAKIDASSAASQPGKAAVTDSRTDGLPSAAKQDWKAMKEQQAAQRKRENDLKKCEERIETLEKRNEEIDGLMVSPDVCTNVAKLQELNHEKEGNEEELAALYEKWEELSLEE